MVAQEPKVLTDFVIIGSGIAGLNAALVLSTFGKVLLITKKKLNDCATHYAQGGIAAVIEEQDSFSSHVQDTLQAGSFHNNELAVKQLVENGPKAIKRLVKLGVRFDRKTPETFATSFEGAHTHSRVLHATDITGQEIEKALITQVHENNAIEVWENAAALDLIVEQHEVQGALVIKNRKVVAVFSRGTVLATGGIGMLYQWTTNPEVATGDGIAMAYRAGAKLSDLEFVQFHPTALKENTSPLFLLSEALRGEGAILRDSTGSRFMETVHPQKDLAPRDIVARTIFQKQRTHEVFLDARHLGKSFITKRFPKLYAALQTRGFDLTADLIPVTPAAHFHCGGVTTDLFGRTSLKNLFAYGETSATGVHGANRLASNSLLEGMVFSSQIIHCIAELPSKPRSYSLPLPIYNKKGMHTDITKQIQNLMWNYVGIERSQKGLSVALQAFKTMEKDSDSIAYINERILETKNMIQVARLIAEAAKQRKSSLGVHSIT